MIDEYTEHVVAIVTSSSTSRGELDRLVQELRSDPERAQRVFGELSDHPSFDVRAWIPRSARLALGSDGLPIIKKMVKDGDADVRDIAIEELVALDPTEARSLIPSLRRRLKSSDSYAPVAAMWMLARLGATNALDDLDQLARGADQPWHQKSAEIAALALRGDSDEVVRRIDRHDHDAMPWLAEAARLIGTPECHRSLTQCADEAPDVACRNACRNALSRL